MELILLLSSSLVASLAAVAGFNKRQELVKTVRAVVSRILHTLLLVIYPIKDAESGTRNLPAVPYEWPGGNGDEAKFLHGPANSLKWGSTLGPIYRLWSGMNTEVVVTRGEHIKAIFHDSDRHLKAKNNDSGWLMGEVLGQCVGLLSLGEWSRLRSRVEVPFLHKSVQTFLPTIQSQTTAFFTELLERKAAALSSEDVKRGAPVTFDAAQDTKMLPFKLVATLLYGNDLPSELLDELERLIPGREQLFFQVIKGGVSRFWWSEYLPTQANRLLKEFQSAWLAFNKNAYQSAKERGIRAPIVELWEQMEAGEIDQKQLLQTLDEIIFANLDVTTGALSWLLVNLAAHPTSQANLYTSLLSSLAASDAPESDTLTAYLNASSTYLSHCVSESARVRPIAAFSVPQATPTARVAGGYRIPAGTSVMVDSYALNIRNPFWGADGSVFRPERWAELKPSETRYNMWRFGFGPRNCMGRFLAEKMLRVAAVQLVRGWELSVEGADGVFEVNPESWITHPDVRIACRPRKR